MYNNQEELIGCRMDIAGCGELSVGVLSSMGAELKATEIDVAALKLHSHLILVDGL